jgi:phenylacetate-CoA ligase
MGRADQTAKVRGMFVHPSQVAQVLRQHPEIIKGRLVVERVNDADSMTLHCEVAGDVPKPLGEDVVATVRQVCNLRGEVAFVAAGTLANDGKVIDDLRPIDG